MPILTVDIVSEGRVSGVMTCFTRSHPERDITKIAIRIRKILVFIMNNFSIYSLKWARLKNLTSDNRLLRTNNLVAFYLSVANRVNHLAFNGMPVDIVVRNKHCN